MNDKYTEVIQPQYIETCVGGCIYHCTKPQLPYGKATVRVYQNDVELIPCKRNEDGVEGFYNPETEEFTSVREVFQHGFTVDGKTYIQHD